MGHANSAALGDNTRPVFGSTDREGGRAFDCSNRQRRTEQPGLAAAPFLADGLGGALKRLDDGEIDELLTAVTAEAERRGRRPPSPAKDKPVADAKPQRRQEAAEDGATSLTTGKLNAVRAAFKAGVKPSAIAKQFGILQSDFRKALALGPRREA